MLRQNGGATFVKWHLSSPSILLANHAYADGECRASAGENDRFPHGCADECGYRGGQVGMFVCVMAVVMVVKMFMSYCFVNMMMGVTFNQK